MFNKLEIPIGPSFPFIEHKDGSISMKYDSIKVSLKESYVTMTFIQDGIEIYAYTYRADGDHDFIFEGMHGKVDIKFTT